MCGLVGFFGDASSKQFRARVLRGTELLAHRGPDDEGHYFPEDGGAGLGFRRLAILDLSAAGHQPMFNETRDVALVFNGEIYNYREIRARLESRGHVFRSNADSEVLVHLWEEEGMMQKKVEII